MNLLANAAEDNEAYENTLTQAQLQQLHQHLLQQQFQHQVITCKRSKGQRSSQRLMARTACVSWQPTESVLNSLKVQASPGGPRMLIQIIAGSQLLTGTVAGDTMCTAMLELAVQW